MEMETKTVQEAIKALDDARHQVSKAQQVLQNARFNEKMNVIESYIRNTDYVFQAIMTSSEDVLTAFLSEAFSSFVERGWIKFRTKNYERVARAKIIVWQGQESVYGLDGNLHLSMQDWYDFDGEYVIVPDDEFDFVLEQLRKLETYDSEYCDVMFLRNEIKNKEYDVVVDLKVVNNVVKKE